MPADKVSISKIELRRVTKIFGAVRALAGVNLLFEPGAVTAVMGPNGAGKSTLLGLLSLNVRPTKGSIYINGEDSSHNRTAIRGRIGLLSHQPLVYPDLTVRENLRFFAGLSGDKEAPSRVGPLIDQLAMGGYADDRPTRVLSRGQLQRAALARALLSKPDLLLLDEPAAGLDSAAIRLIRQAVQDVKSRDGTVVLVTHEPEVAAAVADRAVMIAGGRVCRDEVAPGDVVAWRNLYVETVEGGPR